MDSSSSAPLAWHDFLERMRHPSASDFVKSIKSFIISFLNKPPDPEKDSAAVQEFLSHMEGASRAHMLWAGSSEEDLESASETKLITRTMGAKDRHRHKISSFNPAWCLRPPPIKATTPRNITSNNGNKSPLPTAYRPKKPHHLTHHSPELTIEPTSPRVGCMGQIRRCKSSSRATGAAQYSSASSSRSSSISPQFNLTMLKKGSSSSVNTSSSLSRLSSASPSTIMTGEFSLLMLKRVSLTRGSFEEMDPPRPVERKEVKPENSLSLWKRRCAGGDGLQVQLQPRENTCVLSIESIQ